MAGLRQTSEDLKLARGCLPLAPFFKTPQFYGVCRASTRSEQCCRPPRRAKKTLGDPRKRMKFQENARNRTFWSHKERLKGWGFRGPWLAWRGNNGAAALSRAPQGSLCPGASLTLGGSWSSFITLLPTSVQNLERWIQRTRKIGVLKFCGNH